VTPYKGEVEALGYGATEDEVELLRGALEEAELGDDVSFEVLGDDTRGMIFVGLSLEAVNAIDAHELAMTVWSDAWEAAFGADHPPTEVLVVRCLPVGRQADLAVGNGTQA
jgi:hypothetical protein